MEDLNLKKFLPGFQQKLYDALKSSAQIIEVPENQVVLKEGYYVNSVPIVLEGLLKVTKRDEEKEILLYYIEQGESCIMSYSACIFNTVSQIVAITERHSKILLLPSATLMELIRQFPELNRYFNQLYQDRYEDLIATIDQIVFRRFDERIYNYLLEKSEKLGLREIRITHQEMSNDLGTAREVVSRALKKLEKEQKVILHRNSVKIL